MVTKAKIAEPTVEAPPLAVLDLLGRYFATHASRTSHTINGVNHTEIAPCSCAICVDAAALLPPTDDCTCLYCDERRADAAKKAEEGTV